MIAEMRSCWPRKIDAPAEADGLLRSDVTSKVLIHSLPHEMALRERWAAEDGSESVTDDPQLKRRWRWPADAGDEVAPTTSRREAQEPLKSHTDERFPSARSAKPGS